MITQELIERLYGVSTYTRDGGLTTSVGVAPVRIVKAHPGRVSLHIVNNSAGWINVFSRNNVSATRGYRLAPSGGSLIIEFQNDFSTVTSEYWAIAQNAGSAISIIEILIASKVLG